MKQLPPFTIRLEVNNHTGRPKHNTDGIRLPSFREQHCSTTQPKPAPSTSLYIGAPSAAFLPGPLEQRVVASRPASCPVAPRHRGPSRALPCHRSNASVENTSKSTTALLLLLLCHRGMHSLHGSTTQLTPLSTSALKPALSQGPRGNTHLPHLGNTRTSSLPRPRTVRTAPCEGDIPCPLLSNTSPGRSWMPRQPGHRQRQRGKLPAGELSHC